MTTHLETIVADAAPAPKARLKKVTANAASTTPKTPLRSNLPVSSKSDQLIKKLSSAKGVTIPQMMEATGWQAHSVRGFLSAVVKKKLGHTLVSEVGKDGVRRYRIAAAPTAGEA